MYAQQGFELASEGEDGSSVWAYDFATREPITNEFIAVEELVA